MSQLLLSDMKIRQDADGRYCLNDLHKAAGGARRHETSLWMANAQTKALCAELENTGIPVIKAKRGRNGGTFVTKPLVFAYAMWISAAFQIKVMAAYDTLQTQGVAVSESAAQDVLDNPLVYMKKLFAQAEALDFKNKALLAETLQLKALNVNLEQTTEGLKETLGDASSSLDLVASTFEGVHRGLIKKYLVEAGYLYVKDQRVTVYAKYSRLFETKHVPYANGAHPNNIKILVTRQGKALLAQLYATRQLPLKKGY